MAMVGTASAIKGERPTVHIVDDDPSFRAAISNLLSASGYEVSVYESAVHLLKKLPESGRPGCILLDIQMPGLSGPELQDQLARSGVGLPIVFVTGHGDIPTAVKTIKAGADEFLTKPVSKTVLQAAIERALIRYGEMRERDAGLERLRSLVSELTPRERDVFSLLVRGKPHKEIAYILGTSERTIKAHRHNLMTKCQVSSLGQLGVIAERLGLASSHEP
jgi:RNA polymerase sigma factor (sigma-70 family)